MADQERSSVTTALLNVIRLMGYHVKVHRQDGVIEIEAVRVNDPNDRHLVKRAEPAGADGEYAAACELAALLDVDWEEF